MLAWFFCKEKDSHSSSRKDDFVSLASHELRSPLSIIKWYTEILLDGDAGSLTDDQKKYLTVIQSSNQRAIDLVRSLLNVSRLDLDTFSVSPTNTSLPSVVRDTIDLFANRAEEKHITITYTEKDTMPPFLVDPHVCQLLIKQLLENAITFSQQGGAILIESSVVAHKEIGGKKVDKKSVVISVTDSGIGIPEKDYAKVFTKMARGSNVQDSDAHGSGLGLYISKTVANSVGGDVWFTSEEGNGSTFYLTFPSSGMKKKEGRTVLE